MALVFNSTVADIAVVTTVCFALIYLYLTRNFNYWKNKGVHYVQPVPLFGNMWPVLLQQHSIGSFVRKVYEEAVDKPYVGIFAMNKPSLVVRNLDLVRCIMVKDAHAFLDRTFSPEDEMDPLLGRSLFGLKGKKWRHLRIKLTPTFTSGKMKKMFYLVDECGKQLVQLIDEEKLKGEPVVVKETMARYSTDVIASCAFGVNSHALQDGNCEFRSVMRRVVEQTFVQNVVLNLSFLLPSLAHTLKLSAFDASILQFMRRTLWDVVEHRQKNGVERKDFVDLLMQIRDSGEVRAEDGKDAEEIRLDSQIADSSWADSADKENNVFKLDGDDFVAQAFVFLAAGFETSSSVLNYTLYELALNPEVQDKLRQEIVSVLSKHGGKVTYDSFSDMPYLEMVVSESLRKYPTLPFLDRKCVANYNVPGTKLTIPKDTSVLIPVWAIHNDPELYPDPEKFDPERFTPENKSKRHRFAHLPFGEGPRICIGMRFGQMQVKTAMAHILSNFQVSTCAATPKPPLVMKNCGATLMPRDDIPLVFTRVSN